MTILVRNLSRETTEEDLWQMFLPFGRVRSLTLVMDPLTGKSKGFGFVVMPKEIEGMAAIKELNGSTVRGEKIRVKVSNQAARPGEKKIWHRRPAQLDYKGRPKPGGKPETCWRGANRRNPPSRRGR